MTHDTETIKDNIDKMWPHKVLKAFSIKNTTLNEIRKIYNEDIIVMKIYTPSNVTMTIIYSINYKRHKKKETQTN